MTQLQDLDRCVIGIRNSEQKTVGAGLIIPLESQTLAANPSDAVPPGPVIAVTCAHVVQAALGKPDVNPALGHTVDVYGLCDESPVIAQVLESGWSPLIRRTWLS